MMRLTIATWAEAGICCKSWMVPERDGRRWMESRQLQTCIPPGPRCLPFSRTVEACKELPKRLRSPGSDMTGFPLTVFSSQLSLSHWTVDLVIAIIPQARTNIPTLLELHLGLLQVYYYRSRIIDWPFSSSLAPYLLEMYNQESRYHPTL